MKQVVITGGSGGLGTAIIAEFRDAGWEVLAPTRAELDVRNPDRIRSYFADRTPDLLVCAAGVTRDALLPRLSEGDWDEVIEVNYHGAVKCAKAVIPAMVRRGEGHIVFFSSHSAIHPPMGQVAYAAAKAALLGFTAEQARLCGGYNVRVNAILPGFLETRMTEVLSGSRVKEVQEAHVLGRFNTPSAVAGFVRFLHESLPHSSGQMFQLDSRIA